MTKHTPREMKVSDRSLWGDTPWHPHVRMARIIEHSPMNGMDADHLADELAKRWNCHCDLLKVAIALKTARDRWRSQDETRTIDSIEYMDLLDTINVDDAIAKANGLAA